MKKNNFLRNLSIATLTMCSFSVAAGFTGQATLPSPITKGYDFPAVRLDDGSYLKTVLNDRERRTVTLVNGAPNENGELDIPENVNFDKFGKFTITEIGEGTFSCRDDIRAVRIPPTVPSLNRSFDCCPNMEVLSFPGTPELFNEVQDTTLWYTKNLNPDKEKKVFVIG